MLLTCTYVYAFQSSPVALAWTFLDTSSSLLNFLSSYTNLFHLALSYSVSNVGLGTSNGSDSEDSEESGDSDLIKRSSYMVGF